MQPLPGEKAGLIIGLLLVGLFLMPAAVAQEELIRQTTMDNDPTTPSGDIIAPIYVKIIWASLAVFLLVGIILVYILVRFRRRRGEKRDIPQIHGNSRLEIAWTIGPALVMVWLLVISYNGLLAIDIPEAEPEVYIDVLASRFTWEFTYPDGSEGVQRQFTIEGVPQQFATLRVQEDTWVQVNVTSRDVIHAFAVPGLDVMIDANPGRINKVQFYAREPGAYLVQCRQFCGQGHGEMLGAIEVFAAGSQSRPYGAPDSEGQPPGPAPADRPVEIIEGATLFNVSAGEFFFDPDDIGVEPGESVQVILQNDGNAVHNLFIGDYDRGGFVAENVVWMSDNIGPGARTTFNFTAPEEPVAYTMWCNVPGHAQQGMLGVFTIGDAELDVDVDGPRLPSPGLPFVLAAVGAAAWLLRRR